MRQSVYSRLAGSEDLDDAERLAADPTFRLISSQRIWERNVALINIEKIAKTLKVTIAELFRGV